MWNWRFYNLIYKCSAFLKEAWGQFLLEFKRKTPGQAGCKFWQLLRGGVWRGERGNHPGKVIVAFTVLVLIWLANVNNLDTQS